MNKNILLFDGAMGTMLLKNGIKNNESCEIFGFNNKEIVLDIHKSYLEAGCDIITTNTLLANRFYLKDTGYSVEEIIKNSINIAKEAIKGYENKFIALDVGPIPMIENNLSYDETYEIFKEVAILGEKYGVDFIYLETMMEIKQVKIAVKACRENTNLPIFCSMPFYEQKAVDENSIEKIIDEINKLDIEAFGVNCSFLNEGLDVVVEKILRLSNKKVIVMPNTGRPINIGDDLSDLVYENNEDEFFRYVKKYIDLGVDFVGGCCGTTPLYIKKISDYIKNN